ncbi:hypothetical protein ADK67_41790 [Saccharothrix sp. NRRL B-16348]|uniref:hypothetical protein n=1 Tax=Saccharothrix sp. NRRL B-16348 TaxID=1415542 RepID=UPI0006AEEF3B|nr:hypothetical protein [Saccharothrix sp. NRRL B-16348]KOX15324.1 hypothetical protein ADK67_41790 [Saccharothrix sp. NRRL B-16348]
MRLQPAVHQNRESYERERQAFYDRERAWQQANRNNERALRNSLALEGISWEDYQKALADVHK